MAYYFDNNLEIATKKPIDNRMTIGNTGSYGIYDFATTTALYNAHVAGTITLYNGLMVTDADTHITYECVFVDGAPTFVNRSFGAKLLVFIDDEWKNQTYSTLTVKPEIFVEFKAITFGNIKEVYWDFGSNAVLRKPYSQETSASQYDPHVIVEWNDTTPTQKNILLRVKDIHDNTVTNTFTVDVVPSGAPPNPFYYGLSESNVNTQGQYNIDASLLNASSSFNPDSPTTLLTQYNTVIIGINGYGIPLGYSVFPWFAAPTINPASPNYTQYREDLDAYHLLFDHVNGDKYTVSDVTISGVPYKLYKYKGSPNTFGEYIGVVTAIDTTYISS